ncbi:hypothetical protein KHS38_21385 [Mucilaginibacter sp. Bleaf8]|uniref:hypothetical protein n=1 Tax=Mucilaginibacter sp. Bleaf8 TaxID=2834430 RepID=UPI001BCED64B|nr:hypothetical protein [Mucilaginibacter sp. Bleaf8]MBS7566972.1 hypothetical protein [Mucilaginibacter sp. Bleaf8]
MKKRHLLSALLLVCTAKAYAGWPIGKYRHIIVPSLSFYYSKNYWDANGRKVVTGAGNQFSSVTAGVTAGYGLSRRTDLYVSLPFTTLENKFVGGSQTQSGLGDATVGLSYNIAAFKYKRYLSVQGTVIAPLYSVNQTGVPLGYGTVGAEGKLMFSGAFVSSSYFNMEAGYRRYFDNKGPNQIVYDVNIGTPLDERKKNQLTFDVGGVTSFSSNKNLVVTGNPNLVYDGYYVKTTASYGHKFTNKVSVFASAFYTVVGRNASIGSGGSLFMIYKF